MRCLLDLPLWFRREAWRFLLFQFSCRINDFLPPSPLPPFPSGRGSLKVYFAGGFAPGTPALNRLRHLQTLPYGNPAGGLPSRSPGRPVFSFISFPHPPAPLPVGKGAFSFLMQGASPLASPRPSRKRHGLHLRCGCPAGGLPGRSAADLAFSFISFPHPPAPLPPPGKGESQSLFRRGLRPRHPCTESPTALTDAAVREPGGCTPAAPLAGNLFLSVLRRTIGSAPGDARGEAPCIRKLKISPFPAGEGGRGDRGQNQN